MLISRNFRGDIPMETISEFKSKVIEAQEVRIEAFFIFELHSF